MQRKHKTHSKFQRITKILLAVLLIASAVLCAEKIKLAQNQKNIIGIWENSNAEVVITVQDNEVITINQDMPDAGLYCGNASYHFNSTGTIFVSQEDTTVEFGIDVKADKLKMSLMGQEYLILHRQ